VTSSQTATASGDADAREARRPSFTAGEARRVARLEAHLAAGPGETRSVTVHTPTGDTDGTAELPGELFDAPVNTALMHQVVTAQLAAARQGTHSTKTRGETRGGGKKPYRQKGTGRARQGSRTAPHYRGGGAVFGPHPRSYEQRLPRKMKRLALRGALTAKLGDEAIKVIDAFGLDAVRTRDLVVVLGALEARGRVLVVAHGRDEKLELSARNLPTVEVILADSLNVVDLLKADLVLIEQPALARMEEVYA
jgi:large subunit ribosomal protein L4